MPGFAAAVPIITGLLSAGGQSLTNRANAKQAKEQEEFQERMSSTSAQRAMEDYRKAGLNPALAYERGASSPSGQSATMGDVVGSGISSAQGAKALQNATQMNKAQMSVMAQDMATSKSQEINNLANAARTEQERRNLHMQGIQGMFAYPLNMRQLSAAAAQAEFANTLNPATGRQRAAEALLREYELPGARNTADWESLVGTWGRGAAAGLHSAKSAAEILKALRGGTTINKNFYPRWK